VEKGEKEDRARVEAAEAGLEQKEAEVRGLRKERNALISTLRQLERENEARLASQRKANAVSTTPNRAGGATPERGFASGEGGGDGEYGTPFGSPARRPLATRINSMDASPNRLDRLAATVDSLLRD
jgi:hypothetical protein